MKGVRAAGDQFEPLPVDAIRLFIILEVFKQGRDAIEAGGLVALHGRKDIVDIRGGEKNQGGALNQAIEHYHNLPINVKEGQEGYGYFLTLLKYGPEGNGLGLKRDNIMMSQDGRLRESGRSSGIRQSGDIFLGPNLDLGWPRGIFFVRVLNLLKAG